jgi:hypothetical protein
VVSEYSGRVGMENDWSCSDVGSATSCELPNHR